MSENVTPTPEGTSLCQAGSKTDHPCWRETTTTYNGTPYCGEHVRLFEIGEEEDGWTYALRSVEEWFSGPVEEDQWGQFERLAWRVREEVRREYAQVSARAYAAKMLADQGPSESGEPTLTPEQGEELARLMIRADSFNDARTTLEDAPADVVKMRNKWVVIDALVVAHEEANKKFADYKEELGL